MQCPECKGYRHDGPCEVVSLYTARRNYLASFDATKLRALVVLARSGDRLVINNQWGDSEGWKEAMVERMREIAVELKCKYLQFYALKSSNGLQRLMMPLGFNVAEEIYFFKKEVN